MSYMHNFQTSTLELESNKLIKCMENLSFSDLTELKDVKLNIFAFHNQFIYQNNLLLNNSTEVC